MATLTSTTSQVVPAIFALDIITAVLALLLCLIALGLVAARLKNRSSRNGSYGKAPGNGTPLKTSLATHAFLIPSLFCLGLAYALQSATVVLQLRAETTISVTSAYSYSYPYNGGALSSSPGKYGGRVSDLSFAEQFAAILFTTCLNGAVWLHSSHVTSNGTGIGQPSRLSKIWNTIILLLIFGTGLAAWGRGLYMRNLTMEDYPLSYGQTVGQHDIPRILYIVFRSVVVASSMSVSIEVLRKYIKVKNNGTPGNPERPILARFTFVVVPAIWLRDAFIIFDMVLSYYGKGWGQMSQQAVAFLLIIFGQYANLIILFMVLWGAWSMGRSAGKAHTDES